MDASVQEIGSYAFGSYRLDPRRRRLTRNGVKLPLSARLLDTLLYLVENHHRMVPREEIETAVWGARTVEATSLAVAISSLRKALQADGPGGGLIATMPRQGYKLAVPVTAEFTALQAPLSRPVVSHATVAARPAWRRRAAAGLAIALASAGASAAFWYLPVISRCILQQPPAFAPPPHSVAVMAFTNLSGDAGQVYFSDGLAEELIDSLGQIGALHVAARTSSFSFKGSSTSVRDIARRLNVGAVLQGSVQRAGSRVLLTVYLIDGRTGGQIWAHRYGRSASDVLGVQEELADAVVGGLRSAGKQRERLLF